ncbi:hypothetical protein PAPYR_11747 [Paratrimastix pyriformis]|uniref:Uncharacterized protein n=1 Tax=Paratrimastix pyriformis TaxID=342808 RepID=A0ABQ8U8M4_9EUKA|nr:hypothetical protein PAPYR_11747 [Paratrimastix pyriformis]
MDQSPQAPPAQMRPPRSGKTVDRMRKELEEKFRKECTFQPRISSVSRPTSAIAAGSESRQQRMERLAHSRDEEFRRREQDKAEREQEELAECTFQPQVNQRPQTAAATGRSSGLEDRLLHEADNKAALRERAKRLQEDLEMAQNGGFRPQINDPSQYLDLSTYRPIHERVGALQRAREEKLRMARMQAAEAARKRQQQQDEQRTREAAYTFAPQVNPFSEKLVRESQLFSGPNRDFLERQAYFEQQRRKKQAAEMLRHARHQPFRPDVRTATQVLEKAGHPTLREDSEARVARLALEEKTAIDQRRQMLEKQYYAQYQFKPSLNKLSRQLGRAHSIEELVSNSHNKKVKEEAARAADMTFRQQHPFTPQLDTETSKLVVSSPTAQHKRLPMEDMGALMAQLQNCTFAPEITHRTPKQPTGPILVRGLGRHLELQDAARRRQAEQREREAKIFLENPGGGAPGLDLAVPAGGPAPSPQGGQLRPRSPARTVPKPFRLSTNPKASQTKAKIQEELEQQRMAECTFHPRTNDASLSHHQLIDRLLSDDQQQPQEGDLVDLPPEEDPGQPEEGEGDYDPGEQQQPAEGDGDQGSMEPEEQV